MHRVLIFLGAFFAAGAVAVAQNDSYTSFPSDDYLLRGGSVRGRSPAIPHGESPVGRDGQPVPISPPGVPTYGEAAGAEFTSLTSLTAPKGAKSSLLKALRELAKGQRGKVDKAIDALEKAVAIYPDYALAWSILGQVRLETGDLAGSEVALMKAIDIDPRYIRPYEPFMRLRMSQNDWEQVDRLANHVLAIAPTEPTMLWYKALASFRLGRPKEAISFIDKVHRAGGGDAQIPQTHQVLGVIYAEQNQFPAAAAAYRRYLELAPDAASRSAIERQFQEWRLLGLI